MQVFGVRKDRKLRTGTFSSVKIANSQRDKYSTMVNSIGKFHHLIYYIYLFIFINL